jgi:hypothetical protein
MCQRGDEVRVHTKTAKPYLDKIHASVNVEARGSTFVDDNRPTHELNSDAYTANRNADITSRRSMIKRVNGVNSFEFTGVAPRFCLSAFGSGIIVSRGMLVILNIARYSTGEPQSSDNDFQDRWARERSWKYGSHEKNHFKCAAIKSFPC